MLTTGMFQSFWIGTRFRKRQIRSGIQTNIFDDETRCVKDKHKHKQSASVKKIARRGCMSDGYISIAMLYDFSNNECSLSC
jgi:hypothetical protein